MAAGTTAADPRAERTGGTDPPRPAHGGPAPRWSPRRLGHHRYLWWLGAVVLSGIVAVIAVAADTSPGPGFADDGAVSVLTVVVLAVPILLWGFVHQLLSAFARRVRDDVRVYGTGQPVQVRSPDPAAAADGVRWLVDVDHVPAAVRVRDRHHRRGRSTWLDDGHRSLRLRAGGAQMTASTTGAPMYRARRSGREGRRVWEIAVEGIRLSCEVRGRHPLPRRTLIDDDGVAWLVRIGPRRRGCVLPAARLPERLSPAAAAFCVWVLAELDATIRAARDAAPTAGRGDDGSDSSGWDTGHSGGDSGGDSGGSGGD